MLDEDFFNETMPTTTTVMECVWLSVDFWQMRDCNWVNGFLAGVMVTLVALSLLFCAFCCCCYPCCFRRHHSKDTEMCVRSYSMVDMNAATVKSISAPLHGSVSPEPPPYINCCSIPRVAVNPNRLESARKRPTELRLSTFSPRGLCERPSALSIPPATEPATSGPTVCKNSGRRFKREHKELAKSNSLVTDTSDDQPCYDARGPHFSSGPHFSRRSWRGAAAYIQPSQNGLSATYSYSAQNFFTGPCNDEDEMLKKSQSERNMVQELRSAAETTEDGDDEADGDYCEADDVPTDEVVFRRKFDARPFYRRYRV